jgi:hypothetical protein
MASRGVSLRTRTPEWILDVLMLTAGILGSGAVWYFLSQQQPNMAGLSVAGTFIMTLLAIVLRRRNASIDREVAARAPVHFGELVPGTFSPHDLPPGVPQDTVGMLLGDDLEVLARASSTFILRHSMKPFLSLEMERGTARLSASVVDSSGNRIARIIDNEFWASPEHAFNPRQPDPHSIIVRDHEGIEVFSVRFLNPRFVRVTGRFHLPGQLEPLVIDAVEGIRWPGGGGIGHMTVDLTSAPGTGFLDLG